jgi:outer membrane protein assembly factor BamE (lipoprotein component of BamABCDE complex)
MFRTLLASFAVLACATGCMSAGQHRADVQDESTARLTVGTVQREIRVGLTGAEVIDVLGAPNVVATDPERNETWVYDKVATETVYSTSSGGVAALILGGGGDAAAAGVGTLNRSAGATARTQRTLTIVIRFGADRRVRDFAYRASQF